MRWKAQVRERYTASTFDDDYQFNVCVLSYSNKDHRFGGPGGAKCSTHSHHALLTCRDRLVGALYRLLPSTWDGRLGVLYVRRGLMDMRGTGGGAVLSLERPFH